MLKKCLAVLVLAFAAAPLFADVELQTSINDVFYRGSAELTGSITMTVNDDDFHDASTMEPIFIRVTLADNATLAEDLVNCDLPVTDFRHDPIYLAMELVSVGNALSIRALTETVSIVRWVEGEPSFWLRVQSNSDTWIGPTAGGALFGPNEDAKVSWTMGVSARSSAADHQVADKSNLPFNTRNPDTTGLEEDATSTLICVNLVDSTLPLGERLEFDPLALDYRVWQGSCYFDRDEGNQLGIDFTNDFEIARGKDRSCVVSVGDPKGPGADDVRLCVPAAVGNGGVDGYVKATNVIQYTITCFTGGGLINTDLYPGAYTSFSAGGRGYGFLSTGGTAAYGTVDSEGNFSPNPDSGDVVLYNNLGGNLYNDLDLIYDGEKENLGSETLTIQVCVYYYYTNQPTDIVLDWSVTLVSHDGAEDDAPFDGPDQHRRCAPSEFEIYAGEWQFGNYILCAGNQVSIFFPYLPKFNDPVDPPTFWVGVSYVNQGAVDFAEGGVAMIAYDEDGVRYENTDAMPALPVANQMTWLLWDNLGVVEIRGAGANNAGWVSTFSPAGFGGTRSSMFITGNFEAENLSTVFDGDLDGYLLIGSLENNAVDGAYLPRNYDNDIPGQNADLPLRRSKRAVDGNKAITRDYPAKYGMKNGHYTID
jgi:hypothetical protein